MVQNMVLGKMRVLGCLTEIMKGVGRVKYRLGNIRFWVWSGDRVGWNRELISLFSSNQPLSRGVNITNRDIKPRFLIF